MINYSAEFPVEEHNTIADVLKLACKWITGSPHSAIPDGSFSKLPENSEEKYVFENESVIIGSAKTDDMRIGGLRYIRIEDNNIEWTTSIVTTKTTNSHLISVQVACEAFGTATRLPIPRKPYFIRQALTELGGGMDGSIPVADKPFMLDENDCEIAAALILGNAGNRLPIVYISAEYDGSHILNPSKLSAFVSGIAHVIVEPSRSFSLKLKQLVESRNVYGGSIGIYWPECSARKAYYIDSLNKSPAIIQKKLLNDLRMALVNRRQMANCNWLHLKEMISRCRYETLKREGSTELDKYLDAFESDIAAKDNRILEAEQEILRLNAELKKNNSTQQSSSGYLLIRGIEQDFYRDEVKDTIISAIKKAARDSLDNSRRKHILADILNHNAASGDRSALREKIKNMFKQYIDMSSETRKDLEKIGFNITEDGKHYKAVYHGDGRYTFSLAKTGSDHRGGKNTASDICKALF
jgi:hypothetical protein